MTRSWHVRLARTWLQAVPMAGVLACGADSRGAPEGGLPALPAECGPDLRCAAGQGCFDRRCVPLCTVDQDCASRERCAQEGSATGLCVPRDQPPPVDLCAGKLCVAPRPACHPLTGACVACTEAEQCSADRPVCDRGRGECVVAASELCAPCNSSRECAGELALGCMSSEQPFERACVPSCSDASACPQGFACSPARKVCLPRRGSCTAYRHALDATPCSTAGDCSALGVVQPSAQQGTCVAGACALGCEQTSDCPGVLVCSELSCREPSGAGPSDGGSTSSRAGEGGV
jgi:hypothetical protein